jgi:putative DNA methylase
MIPKDCARLAEVDFPLSAVNAACVEENNRKSRIDSGHISLLHSWWARRPLSSCRAVLLAMLLPDPADPLCPEAFKDSARSELAAFGKVGSSDAELERALLSFVTRFSDWNFPDLSRYTAAAQRLITAAYDGTQPQVLDVFAGGGSIPLEGLRLNCDVTAVELNPVAWLLLKVMLEWSGRNGGRLAEEFETWSQWVLEETTRRLSQYYPADKERRKPLAYLWARTVRCEAPKCGVLIPLVRSLSLSDSPKRRRALRIRYAGNATQPTVEVFTPKSEADVGPGTIAGFKAVCPKCGAPMTRERVQAQLRMQRGGASDALLLAVVRENPSRRGKEYCSATATDLEAAARAAAAASTITIDMPPAPPEGDTGFRARPYGIENWADTLTPRQRLSRSVIRDVIENALEKAGEELRDDQLLTALAACLYAAYSDNGQYHTSLCLWLSEGVVSVFIQGSGVPMRADFVEGNPLSPKCDGLEYSVRSVRSALRYLSAVRLPSSSPLLGNALDPILPDEAVDVVFTDPPYANQIPYAHLADFFYGWLRLGLRERLPEAFTSLETEKAREITENRAVQNGGVHDRKWYELHMREAFGRLRDAARDDAIAGVIFAHKDTDRWESLVSALVEAGWRVTGSWPIATERQQRMRGQGYAALETSVHLICRPRRDDSVGDWGQILAELPKRVAQCMQRFQAEHIRGADLVFACIGPALELYSRYSRVEAADGRPILLSEYFERVWEVVSCTALQHVLHETAAANSFEEDARLTALFLWTLQSSNGASPERVGSGDGEEAQAEDIGAARNGSKGATLRFDVVRRFAQPLGIDLARWERRIIETQKDVVRLLPVSERAKQLFGSDRPETAATISRDGESAQGVLFPELEVAANQRRASAGSRGILSSESTDRTATSLDRVHAAMLLQSAGRTNELRAFLKAEQERSPDFLRLANALAALYPKGSEERRLVEAMLLAVPR